MAVKLCLTLTTLCVLCCTGHFAAAQAISIANLGNPPAATENVFTYTATCGATHYALRVASDRHLVEFVTDAPRAFVADLSRTQFGKTLLEHALAGNFVFSCPQNALHVFFVGFDTRQGTQPRPVNYHVSINNDGTLRDDQGLMSATLDFVNAYLSK